MATLELNMPLDARPLPPLPPLYDPRWGSSALPAASPQLIRLMGFEKMGDGENATTYMQEWLCEMG
ncbi:hypothetical protein [Acidithiobacillus ferriphilus]|uniref:hypothetical protein n=1 Tax=Acidithiobacillus ferriphilus TaxID=1689834 RepID=UPI001C06E9DE|nr:hypothetical protein [Acidithiobacillus ferriphilus]MBU2831874.1 hypothetical protein [Acidithiobacillus ferriphilus]